VRDFDPVVEITALSVFHAGHHLALSGGLAAELALDANEHLIEEPLGELWRGE
jgi:hypothetical protein